MKVIGSFCSPTQLRKWNQWLRFEEILASARLEAITEQGKRCVWAKSLV
jgi:hypothetical protein